MKKFNLVLIILLSLSCNLFAQNSYVECETEPSQSDFDNIHRALDQLNAGQYKTAADSNVPVKFHIIASSNGTGGIDSIDAFNELDICNTRYLGAGIQFVHCGNIDYVNSNNYTDFEKYVDETICDANDALNVLNIYFVQDLYRVSGTDTTRLCGYAYLSDVTKNRLIVTNSCAQNSSTLAHEIGHYFSLLHTHSTSAGDELVDGSNCATAGDELCDTPADPRLSTSVVDAACNYTGTATDANNQAYAPNARNILSYSRKNCRDYFSPQQLQRMNNYWLTYRNYLACPAVAPVGVQDLTKKAQISIFPNPAQEFVTFKSDREITKASLYSLTGKLLLSDNNKSQEINMNLSKFSAGIYFYELQIGNEKRNGKLIKD